VDNASVESLLRFAEEIRPRLRASGDSSALEELESRYGQMRALLDWLLEQNRADDAHRLASILVPFWIGTNRINEGHAWFIPALQGAGAASAASRARALYDHGYLVFWAGMYDVASERFAESRVLAESLGDRDVEALALAGAARVALNDDAAEAVRLLRRALAVTADSPQSAGRSSALHVLGVALQMSGDLDGAREVMCERLETGRAAGDQFIVFVESANLSMVERQLGNFDHAVALSQDALRIVVERRDQMSIPWVLNGLAAVTAAKSERERAATLLGAAEGLLERAGGEWPPDERAQYEETLTVLGAVGASDLERWRKTGRAMTLEAATAYALAGQTPLPMAGD
jgi:tetratricopeptide (TPR) repeat protein